MTTETNWLTPETAIGATLPCGAKVVRAALDDDGDIQVWFDQPPVDGAGRQSHRCGQWYFKPDGTGDCFPPLIRAADMTIDWSRPIVTNAGKPARVVNSADSRDDRSVFAEWRGNGRDLQRWVRPDGSTTMGNDACYIRNATPAEILAHPEVWPEWQDWARDDQLREDFEAAEGDGTVSKKQPLHDDTARVQAMIDTPQPITHAAIVAAVERLPEHLDGPAAIADALCVQLGVEVPEKRAPWEVAYEAWRLPGKSDAVHERVWRAAVEWFVEQIDEASDINDRCNSPKFVEGYRCAFKAVRQTIMGPEQQP